MNRKNNNGMLKNTLYYILVLLAMAGRIIFFFGDGCRQSPSLEFSKFYAKIVDGENQSFFVQQAISDYKTIREYKQQTKEQYNS